MLQKVLLKNKTIKQPLLPLDGVITPVFIYFFTQSYLKFHNSTNHILTEI